MVLGSLGAGSVKGPALACCLPGTLVVSPLPGITPWRKLPERPTKPGKEEWGRRRGGGGGTYPLPHTGFCSRGHRAPPVPVRLSAPRSVRLSRDSLLAALRVLEGAETDRLGWDSSSGIARPGARSRRAARVGREGMRRGDWRGHSGWPEPALGEGISEPRKVQWHPDKTLQSRSRWDGYCLPVGWWEDIKITNKEFSTVPRTQ